MGPIAQLVEQRTFNPWVDGSSPSGPTSIFNSPKIIISPNFSADGPENQKVPESPNLELLDHIKELRNSEYSSAIDSQLAILT